MDHELFLNNCLLLLQLLKSGWRMRDERREREEMESEVISGWRDAFSLSLYLPLIAHNKLLAF